MREIFFLYFVVISVLAILMSSCNPFSIEPTTIKEIVNDDMTVKWLGRSTAFAEVPDIVIAESEKVSDTLCIAENITEIRFNTNIFSEGNEIIIGFSGAPRRYGKPTEVKTSALGYKILLDTNYIKGTDKNGRVKVFHGGKISKDCEVNLLTTAYTRYTLPDRDIILAEHILEENIDYIRTNQPELSEPVIADNLDKYMRQYVGFINNYNQEVIIWINFLKKDSDILSVINTKHLNEGIIHVDDGGSNFWSVYINLTKKELFNMSVNGVA
ncbi:hypothetical protein [Dysgonomonas gadei]|uniref:Uncharacterized protein n=1 Tax=Dysgonomonas gadei ATCC BAA-286 TaxID=742766 RepID=F5IVP5_9BACT|nr:hypothetical protein [Dysgonomonas gadei]EGK02695.1 hypothetical protein HMPREF9455_00945 [Dysgonomonas gadei ATCC BAA-286]